VRVDPLTGVVSATIEGLPSTPDGAHVVDCAPFGACGYMDAALAVGDDIWVASDYGGRVARIEGATNRIVQRIAVATRPGGLAAGGGFLWVFHTLDSTITRIDPRSGTASEFTVPGAQGAGIAYTQDSVWLLSSVDGGEVLRLDPRTLAVAARVPLEPFGRLHPFKEAWSLGADGASLWAANPNYNMVTEVDAASATVRRHVRSGPFWAIAEQPFGVALGGGDVWLAGRSGVGRIDAASGTILGALDSPSTGSGYTSITYGFGGAWKTSLDRGTVTRVVPSRAAVAASSSSRAPT
jgi:streptogramin lyase